jgi:hypothetical protein
MRGGRRHNRGVAVRTAYLLVYGALAALGAALVARPAELWVRGLGLFRPALAWHVPAGWAAAALLAFLVVATVLLAVAFALRLKLPLVAHASFLAAVAACGAVRSLGAPAPPDRPDRALVAALEVAARSIDAGYAVDQRYDPDVRAVQSALDALQPPGFVSRGRTLRFVARLLHGASGPERAPLPGDRPGTVYVGISADGQRAWLSVTTLRSGTVRVLGAAVEARAGTHSAAGGDAALPVYPRTE